MNELLDRLPHMEREAEEHERKARALRQIIAGIRALNGHAYAISEPRILQQNGKVFIAAPHDRDGPRGPQAVRSVMEEDAERVWKVVDLKREVLRRGWAPSPKAVEASVKRLHQLGEVVRVKYAYYRLAPNGANEAAASKNVDSSDGGVAQ